MLAAAACAHGSVYLEGGLAERDMRGCQSRGVELSGGADELVVAVVEGMLMRVGGKEESVG